VEPPTKSMDREAPPEAETLAPWVPLRRAKCPFLVDEWRLRVAIKVVYIDDFMI